MDTKEARKHVNRCRRRITLLGDIGQHLGQMAINAGEGHPIQPKARAAMQKVLNRIHELRDEQDFYLSLAGEIEESA